MGVGEMEVVGDFNQDLLELMRKHQRSRRYTNPYVISGILNVLEEIYGIEDEGLRDWADDMWHT